MKKLFTVILCLLLCTGCKQKELQEKLKKQKQVKKKQKVAKIHHLLIL